MLNSICSLVLLRDSGGVGPSGRIDAITDDNDTCHKKTPVVSSKKSPKLATNMDWESIEALDSLQALISAPPDIKSDATTLEERLQKIVYALNPCPTAPMERQRQRERDREMLEQFHLLGTGGHEFNTDHDKWATPLNSITLGAKLEECFVSLEKILSRLIEEELNIYRRQAQLAPPHPTKSLDLIQPHCELMLDLMQGFQRILNRLQENFHQAQGHQGQDTEIIHIPSHTLTSLQTKLTNLFEYLLREALIVEMQPPQVVKVNTKFPHPLRLRWLVGGKVMSVWSGKLVKGSPASADFLSEAQARELFNSSPQIVLAQGHFKPAGQLSSNTSEQVFKLEFSTTSDGLNLCVVNYRHMQLRRIDRDIKKVKGGQHSSSSTSGGRTSQLQRTSVTTALANTGGGQPLSVTDEKFCIFFHFEIDVGDNRLVIYAFSQPLVVITHGSQEPTGWATITWDNCFSEQNRTPFTVPDRIPWSQLGEMLTSIFQSATGKGLDSHQLAVLRSKLAPELSDKSDSEAMITFSKFAKETMVEGPLGFWELFYGCVKLTEKHFARHWKEGVVYGFIGRSDAEEMLIGWNPGTFLLRFSDSVLGGISICYVASNGTPYSVSPFTTKNLTFRSLSDTLWDLKNLTTLYPTTPKETAFPRHQSTSPPSLNYSVLKGIFAQQSQPKSAFVSSPSNSSKSSPTKSLGSSASTSATNSPAKASASPMSMHSPNKASCSSIPQQGTATTPTRSFNLVETNKTNSSEYVESYPRISLPKPFI